MNTEILNKPVNMQNLSHALAKVKADYVGIINDLSSNINTEKPDWSENDSTSGAYIENRTHYKTSLGFEYSIDIMELNIINSLIEKETTISEINKTYSYYSEVYSYIGDLDSTVFLTDSFSDIDTSKSTSTIIIDNVEYTLTNMFISGDRSVLCCYNNDICITIGDDYGSYLTLGIFSNTNSFTSIIFKLPVSNEVFEYSKLNNNYLNGILIVKGTGINSEIFNGMQDKIASGENSHAEGYGTQASGNQSHAEGSFTTASEGSSHAEGINTTASGDGSHAEGSNTTASGDNSHAEGLYTTASNNNSHAEGYYTSAGGSYSHAEGGNTSASGTHSHAEGFYTTASGSQSHAEGFYTTASGSYSHTEGGGKSLTNSSPYKVTLTGDAGSTTYNVVYNPSIAINNLVGFKIGDKRIISANDTSITLEKTLSSSAITNKVYVISGGNVASNMNAHAEGDFTIASGQNSHTEGCFTIASGDDSHTEGFYTIASGSYSHAEGVDTIASGKNSHVEGYDTIAQRRSQHVFGEYNIADISGADGTVKGNYIEIIGNGTSDSARSNARTLDWSGNEVLAGKLTVGIGPTANMDVATKKYVDDSLSNISVENADWEETDTTDNAYILNKPAIKAGEGKNGVLIGQTELNENYATHTLTINGEASATTFTYTAEDDVSKLSTLFCYAYYEAGDSNYHKYAKIISIDGTNFTIELSNALSASEIINGTLLICFGDKNEAIGENSLAEGNHVLSIGITSHAEGNGTFAYQASSHAEGLGSIAKGISSHAEGSRTKAEGSYSHAEGYITKAFDTAHAEGRETIASGGYSHAQNQGTIASKNAQTVLGTFNIEDVSTTTVHPSNNNNYGEYAVIVGNGVRNNNVITRSNAHTLDWQGNGWYAGKLTVGSAPTENMDVATKQYVDNHVPDLSGYVATADLATLVTPLIQAVLANYGDGDTATYGYVNVNEEEY